MDPSANYTEEQLFEAARKLNDPAEREAFLRAACLDDPSLFRRLHQLLVADTAADQFFAEGVKALNESIVEDPLSEKPGERIGRYKLLQQLGEGGCGVVYMAEQEKPVRRRVALKVIKLGMDTKNVVARFEAERQALAMMDHPNIAHVLDAGATEAGRPFFVMELVRGIKITDYCDQNHLSTHERLELFIQVCHAVQHAHQKGIIHRDLKPSNILVTTNDGVAVPKVIDFGIAKATQGRLTDLTLFTAFEQFLGTPAYMSPEQAVLTSLDVDTRSDIYSLGVLLYELLTGKTPFDTSELLAAGLDELRRTIREQEPVRPSTCLKEMPEAELKTAGRARQSDTLKLITTVRRDLDWVVMKCLEKDRARRYQTVNALAMDVKRYLGNEAVVARPPSKRYLLRKFLARHRAAVAAGTGLVLLLFAGIAASTLEALRARRAEDEQSGQRAEAEKARTRAEDLLGKLELEKAEMLFAVNDSAAALANLARMLRSNPSNNVAATRLLSALTQRSFFLPTEIVLEHEPFIKSIQFSHDEKRIVTASLDGTARVWDAATGGLIFDLKLHEPGSWASFSPDGRMIVTGTTQGRVQLWDGQSGQALKQIGNLSSEISYADFSPDSERLAIAGGEVRIVEVLTSQRREIDLVHEGQARSARFSPDGTKLATASSDGTAQIWDASDGSPLGRPFQQPGRFWYAEFSPDGQRLLAAGASYARVYDIATRKVLFQTSDSFTELYWAQFTPDGNRICIKASDHTVRMLDAFSGSSVGEPLHLDEHPEVVALSPSGRLVIISVPGNRARIWQAPFCVPRQISLAGPIPNEQTRITFSKNGGLVAASGAGWVYVWDVHSGRMVGKPLDHNGAGLIEMDFSADGRWLATGGWGWTARVWDSLTGEPRTRWLPHDGPLSAVQFSPDSRLLLTGSYEGQTARIWDAESGLLVRSFPHPDKVTSAKFSPDGNRVVTGSVDHRARVFDVRSGDLLASVLHSNIIWHVEFSPDGESIATASEDRSARIWNAHDGRPRTRPLEHKEPVTGVQFSPNGLRLLTSGPSREVRIWDARTGKPDVEPLEHPAYVTSALFSQDGERIVTAALDRFVRVWDSHKAQLIAESFNVDGGVGWSEFNSDASWVALACQDGIARLCEIVRAPVPVPAWLCTLAEGLAGYRFGNGGGLVPVSPEELSTLRRDLSERRQEDSYARWASWFFTAPENRSLTPSSSQTLTTHIEFLRQQNNIGSLRQALSLAPTNAAIIAQLAGLLIGDESAQNSRNYEEAAWLYRHALALDPKETAALGATLVEQLPIHFRHLRATIELVPIALAQDEWGDNRPLEEFASKSREWIAGLIHRINGPILSGEDLALSLTGAAKEKVSIGHSGELNAFPFTVEAWFRSTNTAVRALGVVSKYFASSFNGWSLHITQGQLKAWYFKNPENWVWDRGFGLDAGPVVDGKWHHAAFTVDSVGGTLYLDGILKSYLPWKGIAAPCSTTAPVTIGEIPGVAPPHLKGGIDEVRIWNTSRTRAEILATMHRRLSGREKGLVAYFPFKNGGEDASGHGHDALVTGASYVQSGLHFNQPAAFSNAR